MKMPIKHILLASIVFSSAVHANIGADLVAGTSLNDSINKALKAGSNTQSVLEEVAKANPELVAQSFGLLAQLPKSDVNQLLAQALKATAALDSQIQDDTVIAAIELAKADEAKILGLLEVALKNVPSDAQLDMIALFIETVGATGEGQLALRLSIAKRVAELGITEDVLLAGYAASGADTAELEATAAGGPVTQTGTTPTDTGNGAGSGGGGNTASPN